MEDGISSIFQVDSQWLECGCQPHLELVRVFDLHRFDRTSTPFGPGSPSVVLVQDFHPVFTFYVEKN